MKKLTNDEIEFLTESNAIEKEYSTDALEDSKIAWDWAKKQKSNPTLELMLGIHKRLLKRLNPEIAGKIRKVRVGMMIKGEFNEAMDYHKIKEALESLCNPGIYPITSEELIKEWHIHFENIHPHEDGNGRTGRILMNLQRLEIGLPLLIIHEGREQMKYYNWFRKNKWSIKNGIGVIKYDKTN